MTSRGERNNNPGNLEASPWTRSQPGYVGTDGRFAIFDTMANGIAAQAKLLTSYIRRGYNTVDKIIQRYGNDPGTQDDVSVENYKRYVASRLGVDRNAVLNQAQAGALAQAMREFETGNTAKGIIDSVGGVFENIPSPGDVVGSVASALIPDWIEGIFTAENMQRTIAVIVGVILIALAIAAFIFNQGDSIKKAAVEAVV